MTTGGERPPDKRWSFAVICLVSAVVLFSDLRRFRDPVGEKYLSYMPPGGADFVPFYFGACALVSGINPYRNDVAAWRDPWRREALVDGLPSSQVYLPTHLLLYTPLVIAAGGDPLQGGRPRLAARYWFDLNLVFLVLLAVVTWRLLARVERDDALPTSRSPTMPVFLLFALALNIGTELGLERGQSENLTALFCWSAVLLVLNHRPGPAMFLAVAAALLKGYAVLFAAGLGLLLLDRRHARRAIAGALAAVATLLLPVVRYLPQALFMVRLRVQGLTRSWEFVESSQNHSFRNLSLQLVPDWVGIGESGLRLLGVAATVLCFWAARRALRRDREGAGAALWLVLFGTCSLGTMVGFPSVSFSYNAIQVLPGALVVATGQECLVRDLRLGRVWRLAVRVALLAASTLLFVFTLGPTSRFPVDALGLVLLLAVAAAAGAVAVSRSTEERDARRPPAPLPA
jgi:hypothetical protein